MVHVLDDVVSGVRWCWSVGDELVKEVKIADLVEEELVVELPVLCENDWMRGEERRGEERRGEERRGEGIGVGWKKSRT